MNYGDIWSQMLWPAYERLRGRQTPRIEALLAQSQFEPPQAIFARQMSELRALLEHARSAVPFYKKWFTEAALKPEDIAHTGDLSVLPLVDKQMFMAQPELFRADPQPPGSYTKATGGSTGRPLRLRPQPAVRPVAHRRLPPGLCLGRLPGGRPPDISLGAPTSCPFQAFTNCAGACSGPWPACVFSAASAWAPRKWTMS